MKITKKLLSVILSLIMVVCIFSVSSISVTAASEVPFSAVLYSFDETNGTLSLFGSGEMTADHAKGWVGYKDRIQYVVIGDGITSIAPNAFHGCTALIDVVIGKDVAVIGEEAFHECGKLETITLPDSVTTIESNAFLKCNSLKTLKVGKSLSKIDAAVLRSLTFAEIIVDENNSAFSSQDGVLFNKDKTTLIKYPSLNTNTSYAVPDTVKVIGGGAFSDSAYLETLELPKSLTQIDNNAMNNCEKLSLIKYEGSQFDFDKVTIGEENGSFSDTEITYTGTSFSTVIIGAIALVGVVLLVAGIIMLKKKKK